MNKARVLVIDGDDWVARLLADGLREHGFDVSTCLSGGDALAVAATIEADCVITEMVLPELDGPSVARAIRSEKPPLGFVPILFLSNADDMVSRSAAFQAGAGVYLTKPFRLDEVALQVRGLVAMSTRLTGSEKSRRLPPIAAAEIPESISPSVHAIEGNVAQMSVATVLTLLEMERRSGVLKVSEGKHKCELDIIAGYAVGGAIDASQVTPLAVLREILQWKEGRFRFIPGSDGAIPNNRRSIGALLIEAVRLDDEANREQWPEESSTARRSWPAPGRTKKPVTSPKKPSRPPPPARLSQPPMPSNMGRAAPRPTAPRRARPAPPPAPSLKKK